jgi:hypothetical protein
MVMQLPGSRINSSTIVVVAVTVFVVVVLVVVVVYVSISNLFLCSCLKGSINRYIDLLLMWWWYPSQLISDKVKA